MKQVQAYIDDVLNGAIKVGSLERAAVDRHLYDLKHAKKRGYYFDEKKASAMVELFPLVMRHTKGEWSGMPFELTGNQAFIVWCVFGWRRKDGTRRFRYVYITCARKWGKSEFAAALGLIGLALDDPIEPGAEVYCTATKEDQAKIVFEVAKQMCHSSPVLKNMVRPLMKSIVSNADNSFFKPLGSDSKTSDGFNLHMVIMDEIHEWQEKHRGLYEKLTTAHGSRRQPLIVVITTAGDEKSELWQEMDDLCVLALTRYKDAEPPGDNRFAYIARMESIRDCGCNAKPNCKKCGGTGELPVDDPFDESNWRKANPNYPVTPKLEFLREQAADAKHNPAAKHSFLRYHCNQKVSSLLAAILPSTWSKARGELSDWSESDVVCGGWDIGGHDDLAAIGYAARFETGEIDDDGNPIYRYEIDARGYLNIDNPHQLTREPWAGWIDAGLLTISGNELVEMREQVSRDMEDLYIHQWAYDPQNSRDFAQSLDLLGAETVKFYQTPAMWTEPLNRFLGDLKHGRITHNGNSMLEWAALNMILLNQSRGAAVQLIPDKRASKKKIDPIIACVMAYRFAMLAPARAVGQIYIT